MNFKTSGNGHYWRDSKGIWRYSISGEAVPGARDRELWDLAHPYPRTEIEGRLYVQVPGLRMRACPELIQLAHADGTLVECGLDMKPRAYLIPAARFEDHERAPDPEGGMWAPELSAGKLPYWRDVCDYIGWRGGQHTIWKHVKRGSMPGPVVSIANAGWPRPMPRTFWSWPILEQYKAMRPALAAAARLVKNRNLKRYPPAA